MSGIDLSALQADLEAGSKPRTNSNCAVQLLVREHPEAEEVLRSAIADQRRSAAKVAVILTRNGLKISETSIKRHRQGACQACKGATE